MQILEYKKSDIQEIIKLFKTVFSHSESEDEGFAISKLVGNIFKTTREKDMYVFVSKASDAMTGCIIFTRLNFDFPSESFMLSPVAVNTKYQGQGIGQKLINYGISQLREKGVDLVFTYGDPNFYSKTGFKFHSSRSCQSTLQT